MQQIYWENKCDSNGSSYSRRRFCHLLGEDSRSILGLGCPSAEQESMPPLHNPGMAPDENAMKAGIALMVENCVQDVESNEILVY